jgi:purine-binding chemotaxis protein CheW
MSPEKKTSRAIDWPAVKEKLREGERRLSASLESDPARAQQILQKRAERAASRHSGQERQSTLQVLTFLLGGERYGFALSDLSEVLPLKKCVPLPGSPAGLLGVVSVRGEVASVIDLSFTIGVPSSRAAGEPVEGFFLMVRKSGARLGYQVDQLLDIRRFSPEELKRPLEEETTLPVHFVRGVTPEPLVVLDMQALLNHSLLNTQDKERHND